MDITTKVVTFTMLAVAVPGIVLPLLFGIDFFVTALVGVLLLGICIFSWTCKPKYYELTEAGLVIPRPIGTEKIARSRIADVFPVEKKRIRFAIRTFGIGGVFGYYGQFYTTSLGSMTWYVTSLSKAVMMVTKEGRKIMVSPDDTETFLSEIEKLKN